LGHLEAVRVSESRTRVEQDSIANNEIHSIWEDFVFLFFGNIGVLT
jgi:hypothetical protein